MVAELLYAYCRFAVLAPQCFIHHPARRTLDKQREQLRVVGQMDSQLSHSRHIKWDLV